MTKTQEPTLDAASDVLVPALPDWQTLSILVHANAKMGKTTLATTAPLPILALDAEGGWKFALDSAPIRAMYGRALRRVDWNPMTDAPPEYDGTWDICVVTVRAWETVSRTYDWLSQASHDFTSVVIDSITELQRRCKSNLVGTEQMKMQDWGQLLSRMDAAIRGYRDLTMHESNPVRCVIFVAETRQKDGKYRPYMQGQIEVSLPYWMDVVGYLYVEAVTDANGQATGATARRLLVSPHDPQFEAGERVQGRLGAVVADPNLTAMLSQIYSNEKETGK